MIEIKTDVNELKKGMYVSRLDRAWLDTPFMFQGFYIQDDQDIVELKRHCRYVYIDTNKATPNPQQLKRLMAEEHAPRQDGHTLPTRKVDYQDSCSVEEEMEFARQCHADLTLTMDEMITTVKAGNTPNLNQASKTVGNMIDSVARNPDAFMWLTMLKDTDTYTYYHSIDASILAVTLGRHLGLSRKELKQLALGCLLFDIGKVRLPDKILNKPGRLTTEEFEQMKRHVDYSVEIMKGIKGMMPEVIEIARHHHERFDGNGYPLGLKGTAIPTFARIAAIVDCYDAITSNRSYSRAISSHEAIKQLYEWGEVDFQPELIEQFIQSLGIYPTGSLVELSTGQVGIVLSQNRVRRLRPKIMLILDAHKVSYEHFPIVDLAQESTDEQGKPLDIINTHEPGTFGIDPKTFYL